MNNQNGLNPRRQRSAEVLLDALSCIDDRYIFEAECFTGTKKAKVLTLRRLTLIAACFALIATIALGSVVGLQIIDKLQTSVGDSDGTFGSPEKLGTLAEEFEALRAPTQSMTLSKDDIDLFNGKAQLIWKYTDEESYRVCSLSNFDAERISEGLQSKRDFTKASPTDYADSTLDGVWVCFGDGLVYTPCLKTSSGNVGFGELFTYDPEFEPSAEFIALLRSAVTEK